MPRFYCPTPLVIGQTLSLPDPVLRHLAVLRMKPGDSLTLFNGEGGAYVATLVTLERRAATAEIKVFLPDEVELPYALCVAQALPEGSKMDWIVEKAVELGVTHLQALHSTRAVVRLDAGRAEKKLAHWEHIVIAASEQCGRNRLMHVHPPLTLNAWLTQPHLHKRILLSPRAPTSLADWARHQPAQALTLLIGPEGGFSAEEEDLAERSGSVPLSLGNRILRTETAALVATSVIHGAWGGLA